MSRDFTCVDDIVDGVLAGLDVPPLDFIGGQERAPGHRARLELQPMQPGDGPATHADVSDLPALTGRGPRALPIEEGLRRFADGYRRHHGIPAGATTAQGGVCGASSGRSSASARASVSSVRSAAPWRSWARSERRSPAPPASSSSSGPPQSSSVAGFNGGR